MYKTIKKCEFIEALKNSYHHRNRFSIIGLEKLFEALTEWESDFGKENEFDLDLGFQYTEATPNEIAHDYDLGIDENDPQVLEKVLDELPNKTFVVCSFKDENGKDKIIYANF